MPDEPDITPPGGAVLDIRGKSYALPAAAVGDKKLFHAWCNSQAINEVAATRDMIGTDGYTAERYGEAYDAMTAKVGMGWWAPGKPGYQQKLVTMDGLTYMAWLCLHRGEVADKVRGKDQLKLEDVRDFAATQEGLDELWEKYQLANANPTPPSPP